MKLRLLAVVSAALTMALCGAALSQDKQEQPGDLAGMKLESKHQPLKKVLGSVDATPAQVRQIFEIRERYDNKKRELKASSKEHLDLARVHAIQEEAGKAIANVLSPTQFQKLRSSGGIPVLLGEDRDSNPWDFLTKLDLTQDQAIHLKKIVAQANKSTVAIEKDGSLSADQVKTKLGAVHDTAISQLEAILTADQQRQLHKLLHEQSDRHVIKP